MTPDQVAADIKQMLDGLTGELRARKAARLADPNTSAIWRALYAEPTPTRKRKASDIEPELLTLDQAAAHLNITDEQVVAFVADGTLGFVNVGRGKSRPRYRFSKQDLDAFIEHRRQKEVPCPSTRSRTRRSTTSTSGTVVIGFTARRNCTDAPGSRSRRSGRARQGQGADQGDGALAHVAVASMMWLTRFWTEKGQHDAEPDATSKPTLPG